MKAITLFFLTLMTALTYAQQPEEMILWPNGAPDAMGNAPEDKPTLTLYPAPAKLSTGAAIILCPGGGYTALATDHEGKQIAEFLNGYGISVYMLKYRLNTWDLKKYAYPAQFDDATRAMRLVRSKTTEWKLDPYKIGIMGFSAGGHLASTVATKFDGGKKDSTDPIEKMSSRPDFLILGYPVISLTTPYTHEFSRKLVLGGNLDPAFAASLSNELQVTSLTPPTFLFHTNEDDGVPSENSVLFYMALRKANVPAELHIFQKGKHGVGLAKNDEALKEWSNLLINWLKIQGVVAK